MRDAPTFLHADLDAFYASVEQLLDPSLRGKPIAVGGGVVLAASYEARAFGVRGGMSGRAAKQLCPHLRFVGGHFREYQRLGDQVIDVLRDVSPYVERISIDEAFVDIAGATHLFGPPRAIATLIRERVRREIGLAVSIGAATTKHLAKVASDVAKPDGLLVVEAGTERAFLDPLPVGLVWGVGPATEARLASRGITTIGQLAESSPGHLRSLLGEAAGQALHARAHNIDARRVVTSRRASSVGAQAACGRREPTDAFVAESLSHLADRIARRLRGGGRVGRTVHVRVRFADLRSVTRAHTLAEPTADTLTIVEVATTLVRAALADHPEERVVSLLGISVGGLADPDAIQLELPLGAQGALGAAAQRGGSTLASDRRSLDRAMDAVREKFGSDAVTYWAGRRRRGEGVDDEFRSLAEHDV